MARRKKKYNLIFAIVVFIFFIAIPLLCEIFVLNEGGDAVLPEGVKLHEKDYVSAYCNGIEEYTLPDKTRIDCLTETYACEFDWAKKWYEGFGQALWYSDQTGKKPCLALILKSNSDYKYFNRAKKLSEKYDVKLIEIRAKDFAN